jgi:hypothetical protein
MSEKILEVVFTACVKERGDFEDLKFPSSLEGY